MSTINRNRNMRLYSLYNPRSLLCSPGNWFWKSSPLSPAFSRDEKTNGEKIRVYEFPVTGEQWSVGSFVAQISTRVWEREMGWFGKLVDNVISRRRILIDLVRLWEMAFERFANASSNVHSSRHLHASGHSKPVVQLIKNYDMPPGVSSGVGPLTKSNCVSDSAVGCRSVVHA